MAKHNRLARAFFINRDGITWIIQTIFSQLGCIWEEVSAINLYVFELTNNFFDFFKVCEVINGFNKSPENALSITNHIKFVCFYLQAVYCFLVKGKYPFTPQIQDIFNNLIMESSRYDNNFFACIEFNVHIIACCKFLSYKYRVFISWPGYLYFVSFGWNICKHGNRSLGNIQPVIFKVKWFISFFLKGTYLVHKFKFRKYTIYLRIICAQLLWFNDIPVVIACFFHNDLSTFVIQFDLFDHR